MFLFLSKYSIVSLLVLIVHLHNSDCHVRMVCPRPVSPKTESLSTDPITTVGKKKCLGSSGTEQDVLEVHPGLFTIRFEETKFMEGASFRVLLFSASSISENIDIHDEEKRDLKRDKREAVKASSTTTTDSSLSFENLLNLDIINATMNSINKLSDDSISNTTGSNITDISAFNRIIENIAVGNETGSLNKSLDNITAAKDADEKISVTNHTETSTVPVVHDTSTSESVGKVSTTEASEETTASDSKTKEKGKSPSTGNDKDQTCVLLDHIPHNDEAVVNDKCAKEGNRFPLGICEESTYYVTIRIPDLFCPDCYLVVQQVEAMQDNKVCNVSAENDSACVSHISCSRISIRPTSEGMNRDLSYCSNYLHNLPDDWAYRPLDRYKAGDEAFLIMDLLHNMLRVEVLRGLKIGPTEKVEIHHEQAIIWSVSMANSYRNAHNTIVEWSNVSKDVQALLKQNQLVLNIIGSKKSQARDVIFSSHVFSEGQQSYLHDEYNSHGWLIAKDFLGPKAKDPMAALPIGPCVPPSRHFVTFFDAIDAGDQGLLGMTLIENRAYITAVLHVQLGTILSIKFKGSELVGASDIVVSVPKSFSGVFQVALDMTEQMKYLDTVQFLKTVEVKTNRDNAIMVGDLEEGFFTVLRDEKGRVKGMGAFQPTQGFWMRVEIVLSDVTDPSPRLKTAKILGSHSELMDIGKEKVHCTTKFCSLETYLHELSSEFFLHLLSGQAIMEISTELDDFSGNIVGSSNCTESGGLCLVESSLSKNTALSKKYGGAVKAMVLLDRAQVLEISVQINHPEWEWTENNYTACITTPYDGAEIKIPLRFSWVSEELYMATERYPLSYNKRLELFLARLDNRIDLRISNGVHTLMEKKIRGLRKKECLHNKVHVVGERKNYWSPFSAPFDIISGVVMDHVEFMYDNTTTLYLMPNKESFDKCDFTKAMMMETANRNGEMSVSFYKLISPGFLYFADKDSCQSPVPAKLTVQVVQGKDNFVQDGKQEEWCRTSFYKSWREDQLDKWDPPSVTGPVVLGLFLGIITGFGFVLWRGQKMKQMPNHSATSSRNSLSHFVRF